MYNEAYSDRDFEDYDDDEFDGDITQDELRAEDELEPDDSGDEQDPDLVFADPGGRSALRAATRDNPRNLPCPTCEKPNRLTPRDVAHGYQCDSCADAQEGGYGY